MFDIHCWGCGDAISVFERAPVLCRECQEREAASLEHKVSEIHAPLLTLVDERRFDDVTLDQRDPGDEDDARFV